MCTIKIMHTMASEVHANRRKRRFYSADLKTQVMQEGSVALAVSSEFDYAECLTEKA